MAEKLTNEKLDTYWRAVLQDTNAPDIVVSLNAQLQRTLEAVKRIEGELRDWARMEMTKSRRTATVILFKDTGKYYTQEEWEIPTKNEVLARGGNPGDAAGPYCMQYSKDFRRIGNTGAVLIDAQEPWGFPHLFPGGDGNNHAS